MNANQVPQAAAVCGCSPEELQFCLRWLQTHSAPCEWNLADEAEYKAALDAWKSTVAS